MSMQSSADRALQALLSNTFSADLLDILSGLSSSDRSDQLENRFLNVIVSTNDPRLRNATAIALADLDLEIAPSVIRDLLLSVRTTGGRATLLYALRELLGHIPMELAVKLISNDSEETIEGCFYFFELGLVDLTSASEKNEALISLQATIEKTRDLSRRAILEESSDRIAELNTL